MCYFACPNKAPLSSSNAFLFAPAWGLAGCYFLDVAPEEGLAGCYFLDVAPEGGLTGCYFLDVAPEGGLTGCYFLDVAPEGGLAICLLVACVCPADTPQVNLHVVCRTHRTVLQAYG